MPRLNGLELVREARRLDPNLQIVVITAATTLEMAIAALRAEGAYDYLLKPLEAIGELTVAVERAAAHRELQIEQLRLRDQLAQQAAQFQTVVYYSSDAILAADSRDVLTVCNPAATRLLGQDAPIGQAAHSMLPALLATLLVSWRSKPEPEAQTFEVRWPTHRQLQSVALAPLPGNGTRPGWVMVLRDVSHLAE
ncbi:MAG TPA: response regulator [Anaerolineales bacterium]|nr:response regulator [Anaerolineales bacterium]